MRRSSLALLSILALGACAPKAPISADASLDDGPAHPVVHMMATPTAEIPWKPLDPGQPNGGVYTGGVITGSYQHKHELGAVDLGAGAVWWQDAASAHEDVCVGQGPCTTFQVVQGAMSYYPVTGQ